MDVVILVKGYKAQEKIDMFKKNIDLQHNLIIEKLFCIFWVQEQAQSKYFFVAKLLYNSSLVRLECITYDL